MSTCRDQFKLSEELKLPEVSFGIVDSIHNAHISDPCPESTCQGVPGGFQPAISLCRRMFSVKVLPPEPSTMKDKGWVATRLHTSNATLTFPTCSKRRKENFLKMPLGSASKPTKINLKNQPCFLASEGGKSPIEKDISPITYPKRNRETDLCTDPP